MMPRMNLRALRKIYERAAAVDLDGNDRERIAASCGLVDRIVAKGDAAYGINTGFGLLAQTRIPTDQLALLQSNLLLSHAAGVGTSLPDAVARLVMALKINSLARGYSGISLAVVDALRALLSNEVYPVIPSQGSVGASGDLAPLAHMSAVLLGVGKVRHKGRVLDAIEGLRAQGHQVRVLYLDASDAELVRRYGSTRRRHPLDNGSTGVLDAIQRERALLEGLKAGADLVIDTTMLNIHQLKALIVDRFAGDARATRMQTTIVSFGYKHGIPLDVDLVFDCRFLPNPYWVERLREHTGLDPDVRDYVLDQELAKAFLEKVDDLLELLLPAYTDEGKSYLTVAVGCTGGRHRSVAIAEELGRRLRERGVALRLSHRDLSM
jgi:UPF0042 nucleotide-binding protein